MALEKVLVVDDDPNICDVLMMYLENEGYSVILSYDGEEALVKFNALKPDIVLLDVMLPSMDGWQVCREIRKKSSVPIIMITAKGDTFDKVLGLELGADDYIVKPFDTKEVVARIKAIARRVSAAPAETEVREVRYDKLSVNMTRYELRVNGKVVDTPPKELELLFYLASNPNRVYTVTSCWMKYGALNITATPVPLTYTSSGFGKSSKAFLTSGHSRPFGALATSLNLKKKNNERPCEKISPLSSAFPAFNLYGNSGNAIGDSHHCDSQHCLV